MNDWVSVEEVLTLLDDLLNALEETGLLTHQQNLAIYTAFYYRLCPEEKVDEAAERDYTSGCEEQQS